METSDSGTIDATTDAKNQPEEGGFMEWLTSRFWNKDGDNNSKPLDTIQTAALLIEFAKAGKDSIDRHSLT